jgi:hypothetical protein
MKKNLQGYALPLALILVAIFSIFVANISSHTDNIIQNIIKANYDKLNKASITSSDSNSITIIINTQPYTYIFSQQTYTSSFNNQLYSYDRSSQTWGIKNP